jgi:hypothetical protein
MTPLPSSKKSVEREHTLTAQQAMNQHERRAKLRDLWIGLVSREQLQQVLQGRVSRERVRLWLRNGVPREFVRQLLTSAKPNTPRPAATQAMPGKTPEELYANDRSVVGVVRPEDEAATPEEFYKAALPRRKDPAARVASPTVDDSPRAKRARAMDEMYQLGSTLQEVGDTFGVTRERVRQILNDAGFGTRRGERAVAFKAKLKREHTDAVVEAFRRLSDVRRVAKELNLPHEFVKEIVEEHVPAGERRAGWKKPKPMYSDAELIQFLQTASEALGGVLTTTAYTEFARSRKTLDGRNWPTHQTHFNRFGSWRKALEAAGLAANPASAIAGCHLFEAGHCVDAVRAVGRELGKVPTASEYEAAARRSGGALPSQATVRNRCGTWNEVLRMAGL